MQPVPVDFHDAWLRLPDPTREQGNVHRVCERLVIFIDVEGTRVGNVSTCLFSSLFGRSFEPVT